jgi:cytochrome c553
VVVSALPSLVDSYRNGYPSRMSLAEIEQAVDKLSRDELAKLAAYIGRQDKLGWDEQIEEDFAPGGKHAAALERIDADIDAGNFRPMP